MPDYLKIPTLSLHRHLYGVHLSSNSLNVNYRYRSSFFPESVSMWNDLGSNLRESKSISKFKDTLLKLYRPVKKASLTFMIMASNGFFNFEWDLAL